MESTQTDSHKDEQLKGFLSLKLKKDKTLDEFCKSYFDNYDSSRFEAVAVRVYYGKEMIITLYALDRSRQEGTNYSMNKFPVKKFKKEIFSLNELASFVEEFNFTLNTGNYSLEEMEVINK
jgi:hypothetical protein